MPNLTKRTMPDRSKIDIADTKQVKYWTKALDVSKDDLFEAIDKVGNAAATVRLIRKVKKSKSRMAPRLRRLPIQL
jgi:hypothetical protein